MKYFVRKTLDSPIQGIYEDLNKAIANSGGLNIYDENGTIIIRCLDDYCASLPLSSLSNKINYENAWKCLKEYYQSQLDSINELKETNERLPINIQVSEMFCEEIINKMKVLEDRNTI